MLPSSLTNDPGQGGRMTTRLGVAVAGTLLGVMALLPIEAPGVASAISSQPPASWQVHFNAVGANQLEDLSCPTSRECVAVGGGADNRGVIFRTADGGKTWVRALVPPRTPWLQFISCSSATNCVAAASGQIDGVVFMASNDGGARWRVTHRADQPMHFQTAALACVTAATCEAAGNGFFRSRNAGQTWSATTPALSRTTAGPNSLSCPSVTTCFAVVGDAIDGPSGVPGTTILRTTDAGASFSVLRDGLTSPGPGLTSISCVSTLRCTVAGIGHSGRRVMWTVDGGSRWQLAKAPAAPGAIEDVACSGPGTCTLVAKASSASTSTDLVSVSTTTRGASWSVRPLASFVPSGNPSVDEQGAIGCSARGPCFATGFGIPNGSILSSPSRSAPWHRAEVANGLPPLSNVACPTSHFCIATGDQGLVLRSLDGGSTWSKAASQIPSNDWIQNLACATAAYCIATGVDSASGPPPAPVAFVSSDGGATWVASPDPGTLPLSLTCTSATVCVGSSVNAGILRTVNGGRTWKAVSVPKGWMGFGDISCDAAGDCVGVDSWCCGGSGMSVESSGILSTNAGATWSLLPAPPPWATQVSCTTGLTCYLLSTDAGPTVETYSANVLKTIDGGKHWSVLSAPSTLGPIACNTVQCVGIATMPRYGNAVNVSVLWTGTIGASGITWSRSAMPSTDVVLNDVAQNPSGQTIVGGGNALNGPLVLTSH